MPDLSLFDLSGRVALVTGSSDGIGLALAAGLGAAGALIVLNGRNADKLASARERLAGRGISVEEARFDVADRSDVLNSIDRIERDVGPIDILVNNAGIQRRQPIREHFRAKRPGVRSYGRSISMASFTSPRRSARE